GSSPSRRNRSRTNFSARWMSAEVGMVAAARATEVDSAIYGFSTREQSRRVCGVQAARRSALSRRRHRPPCGRPAPYVPQDIARRPGIEGVGDLRALGAMSPGRISIVVAAAALVALLIVGLTQIGGASSTTPASRLTLAQMRARVAGSAAPLAALHEQAGQL